MKRYVSVYLNNKTQYCDTIKEAMSYIAAEVLQFFDRTDNRLQYVCIMNSTHSDNKFVTYNVYCKNGKLSYKKMDEFYI